MGTYSHVEVVYNQPKYLQAVLYISNDYLGNGDFGGVISNAFTGSPEEGVSIALRANINQTSGDVLATTQTSANGSYYFSGVPAGQYTLELSKTGVITNYTSAICIGNQSTPNQNGTISPEIDASEIRIILTWGAIPTDLDSHLTGPAGSTDRFHVYYGNSTYGGINLDVDDVSSYGPETITIPEVTGGLYRYYVHDYSNRNSTSSTGLAQSGARVVVFYGNSIVGTYDVPNVPGTLWAVFEVDNYEIIPTNIMTYESSPSAITKSTKSIIESDFFMDLPEK